MQDFRISAQPADVVARIVFSRQRNIIVALRKNLICMTEGKIKNAYKQSKNVYDDVLTQSKWWSKFYIRFFWGVDDMEIAENLFRSIPNDFDGTLLDVPCGTLNLTIGKYRQMPQSKVICLDYSKDMLDKTRGRLEQYALSHISVVQGDVGKLPFEDASFDIVLSMNGFHAFPDKSKAHAETFRVLKPGGIFLGCFYIQGENRRSDFVVKTILSPRGWFTPPFQTKNEVHSLLRQYYSSVELHNEKAMVWFHCVK